MGECSVGKDVETEIYYESGKISMVRSVFQSSLGIKVLKDKKKGSVSQNKTDDESVKKAVADAMASSEHAKPDEAEGISELLENKVFLRGEAEPDREALYGLMRGFIDDVKRDYPKISFDSVSVQHGYGEKVYMNTNGVVFESKSASNGYSAMFMARQGEKTSSFNYFGAIFEDLETPLIERGMARIILEQTERQIDTKSLEGKFEGELIITPSCLSSFIYYIQSNFLSDTALIEDTSLWKDSLGQAVAAPMFSLHSSPRSEELHGGFFTHDGYEVKNMPIIEEGVLKNFTLSRYGAAKTGRERSASYGGSYIVGSGDKSLEELIVPVKKGLLLNRFSGGSPGANGDFTGVAKNSFLIEDGKITDAVSETMISGNLAQLLMNIKGITAERVNNGSSILPWIRATGVVISGK